MTSALLAKLIVFSPFIGFVLSLCLLRYPRLVQILTCSTVALAFLITTILWLTLPPGANLTVELCSWLSVDTLRVSWGLTFDPLNFLMVGLVTFISFWVHLYSVAYMAQDPNRALYMAYLNLFTFAMVFLLTSPTLIQLFVGWEGVGLASYLLIGFWHHKARASKAAAKAFIVNRIGDAALLLGICLLFHLCQTLDFSLIPDRIASLQGQTPEAFGLHLPLLNFIGFLILLGAFSKSAQCGFHVWLAEAMEAPTPVSALIHAATMVTAGIFLVIKLSPLFEVLPHMRGLMITTGSITALMAAFFALSQTDIKKVIAYSTCSQLGYMVVACGCSAYKAALFHLVTHAFFKALLFLGAGSVIHAMSGEQDIKKMGGLAKLIPYTYGFMVIGSLALAGIPWFSGYYSKDLIIESLALSGYNPLALVFALSGVFLTAFYSWRLLGLVFQGALRTNEQVAAHIHEAPFLMVLPLIVLGLGAVLSGWLGWHWFFEGQLNLPHSPVWLKVMVLGLSSLGVLAGYWLYWSGSNPYRFKKSNFIYQLSYHKGYFDDLYDFLFKRPLIGLGRFFSSTVDSKIIDHFGVGAVTRLTLGLSAGYGKVQNGMISRYIFVTILGLILILGVYLFANFFGLSFLKIGV